MRDTAQGDFPPDPGDLGPGPDPPGSVPPADWPAPPGTLPSTSPPPTPSPGGGGTGGDGTSSGAGGGTSSGGHDAARAAGYQYNDPYTQQYERLAGNQLSLYQQQLESMLRQAYASETQRRATQGPALDRMTGYVNQRVSQLQGPAYTGAEGEVLRTQLLDPLERDRTAARQRALEQVSARGMDPSSGVAQDLLRQVDRAFDEQRARVQGGLAKSQIDEQRSREQEAQQLLQYLAMLPDAVARGDLDFVAYVQSLIAQPGVQSLAVGSSLADLGSNRLNDALATLGMGPSLSGASAGAIGLLNQAQQARLLQAQQQAAIWANIGRSFQA